MTFWKPKRKVWFQKNDDTNIGKEQRDIEEYLAKKNPYWAPENRELREKISKGELSKDIQILENIKKRMR